MKPFDWYKLCEGTVQTSRRTPILRLLPRNRESVTHIAKQPGIAILIGLVKL
jgi:hypothetical protein